MIVTKMTIICFNLTKLLNVVDQDIRGELGHRLKMLLSACEVFSFYVRHQTIQPLLTVRKLKILLWVPVTFHPIWTL